MNTLFDYETILKAYTKEKIDEGMEKGRSVVAKNMLKKGMPMDEIAELSGLSLSEIHKIERQMTK